MTKIINGNEFILTPAAHAAIANAAIDLGINEVIIPGQFIDCHDINGNYRFTLNAVTNEINYVFEGSRYIVNCFDTPDKANEFLSNNPEWGVLVETFRDGQSKIYVAKNSDKGIAV